MPIRVDHRVRKHKIIEQSISLFAQVGYRDVSYQMIADHCAVSRTVLYRYFRNKRQIFDAGISELLLRIAARHQAIMHEKTPSVFRLRQICTTIAATLFDRREFLAVIVDFVLQMRREGVDMARRILTFTVGLKRIVHFLLVDGIRHGEFRADTNPEVVTDLLYAQFEAEVLRLVVSGDAAQTGLLERIDGILKGISVV